MLPEMSPEKFLLLGNVYTQSTITSSRKIALRRFSSFFGVTPEVCSVVWNEIKNEAPSGAEPKHLLWCLSFLKEYSNEHYRRSIFNADEKTIRKWTWAFVKLLSDLSAIQWEKRFDGAVNGQTCFCSLDGVDFRIQEPKPFSCKWFSHKFHAAGLRYEIALNIRTGDIVWCHGGYPCGLFPDLKLAREAYVLSVRPGELTMADKGYRDQKYFILPTAANSLRHNLIMSRHETVNKRLKQFNILKKEFRHCLDKHPMIVHAVATLTQLMIRNGHPLYSVF